MKALQYFFLGSFLSLLSQTNLKIKDKDLYFDGSDDYWAVFTKDGTQLTDYYGNFTPVYGSDTKFYSGYALVKMYNSSNEMGYVNSNGQLLNSFDALGYAKEFNEGYASYRKLSNLKFGIIDNKGNINLPFEYDEISSVCHKKAFVKKNNKWALYDVENKKFITDFKYDFLRYNYSEHRDYFTRIVKVIVNQQEFLLDITNGTESKITGDPSQKIPINRGDYLEYIQNDTKVLEHAFKPEKKFYIKNYSEYNDLKIYNSELLILTKSKRLPYNHPEYDNAYVLANNKGEIIFSDAYGFDLENSDYYRNIDYNQTPRFIRYCKKDKDGMLKYGMIDLSKKKVIIPHEYDKLELIDQSRFLFGAKIKNKCFLLDTNGTDLVSEFIKFNAIPYYVNSEKNFCIVSSVLPEMSKSFKKRHQFYLYDLNGNLLFKESFYNFELINNHMLKLYHFNDDISLLDINKSILKNSFGYKKIKPIPHSFKPIYNHKTEENLFKEIVNEKGKTILNDVISYLPLYGSFYLFEIKGLNHPIYNLNEYKPKLVIEAVLEHTEINDSLHIIYLREKHTLKRGIYDFKNNRWLNLKTNNKEFDFSPNENNKINFVMNQLIYFKLHSDPNYYFFDFNSNEIKNYDYTPLNCVMNGRVNVKFNDGTLGYIDTDGKVLYKCRKNVVENFPFYKNTALLRVKENNIEYYEIIDTLGNILAGGPEFVKYSYEHINDLKNLNLSKECKLNRFSITNNKSYYTKIEQLSNGRIGIRVGMYWSKYFEETGQTNSQPTCNKKCSVCKGTCSYIYQESCDYCTGGVVYESQTSEVIRLGGVSTTTVGGNVITKYESPVIYTKTISRKCSVCNGTGDKPGSNIEFRKCWKCRPR